MDLKEEVYLEVVELDLYEGVYLEVVELDLKEGVYLEVVEAGSEGRSLPGGCRGWI